MALSGESFVSRAMIDCPHANQGSGRSGRSFPFIARLTAAYLNFEVKDAPKARRFRRPGVLEFKVETSFSAAVR